MSGQHDKSEELLKTCSVLTSKMTVTCGSYLEILYTPSREQYVRISLNLVGSIIQGNMKRLN